MKSDFGFYVGRRYLDLEGRRIKRTPQTNPYNYDEFVIWKRELNTELYIKDSEAVYSDRLMQWDFKKFNKCCMQVFGNSGQYFSSRKPEDIEKFLSIYLDTEIELNIIVEGCNQANGYPYWVFIYKRK